MFYFQLFISDIECECYSSGQPVCGLHHDQPEWRGTVMSYLCNFVYMFRVESISMQWQWESFAFTHWNIQLSIFFKDYCLRNLAYKKSALIQTQQLVLVWTPVELNIRLVVDKYTWTLINNTCTIKTPYYNKNRTDFDCCFGGKKFCLKRLRVLGAINH